MNKSLQKGHSLINTITLFLIEPNLIDFLLNEPNFLHLFLIFLTLLFILIDGGFDGVDDVFEG